MKKLIIFVAAFVEGFGAFTIYLTKKYPELFCGKCFPEETLSEDYY